MHEALGRHLNIKPKNQEAMSVDVVRSGRILNTREKANHVNVGNSMRERSQEEWQDF